MSARRVAVIGAGAGGLSAARHLLERGHTVVVYELGSYVGGLWVYDNDNGLSAAYESLHINSEPAATHYRGHPFPDGTPLFPSHREVSAYLNDFAEAVGIRKLIRFNSRVTGVRPVAGQPGAGWTVALDDGTEDDYDDVVVATGHQGVPAHPEFAADFTGEYVHSHDYRSAGAFAGKRVLVIGVGNSGLDIASDMATTAQQTVVAARSPVLIMPRMILGVPAARIMSRINRPFLPWIVQRQVMRMVSRVFHGRMERWGLRTPTSRTHPASSATFMSHVAYRKISCRPGVRHVRGQEVTFTDGSTVEVDTMIAATGYELDLPFLAQDVSPVDQRRIDVYKRVVHPDWPGLFFVGFFNVSGGANISMMDVQSDWVAALVSGDVDLPSAAEMRADIAREKRLLAKNFPHAARYGLEVDPRAYRRELAQAMQRRPDSSPAPGSGQEHRPMFSGQEA